MSDEKRVDASPPGDLDSSVQVTDVEEHRAKIMPALGEKLLSYTLASPASELLGYSTQDATMITIAATTTTTTTTDDNTQNESVDNGKDKDKAGNEGFVYRYWCAEFDTYAGGLGRCVQGGVVYNYATLTKGLERHPHHGWPMVLVATVPRRV